MPRSDADQRRAERHRVLSMSRFLIRVPVPNLASKTLSMCLSRLRADVSQRYRFLPWLVETCVDPTVRACGRQLVGFTRGRQDRAREMAESVKAVYMYVLDRDWRRKLGVAEPALSPGEGIDVGAPRVRGNADRRLSARLVEIARRQGESPMSSCSRRPDPAGLLSVPGSARDVGGDPGEHPGAAPSANGAADARVALCIQDGTDLNFATRLRRSGIIGTNQTASQTLYLHASYVVSGEGLPLARLAFDAPPRPGRGYRDVPAQVAALARRSRRPRGPDDRGEGRVRAGSGLLRTVRPATSPSVDAHADDRVLKRGAAKLFARLRACRGTMQIDIPRLTARPKSSGRKKQRTPRRNAVLELRWLSTALPAAPMRRP